MHVENAVSFQYKNDPCCMEKRVTVNKGFPVYVINEEKSFLQMNNWREIQ